MKTITTEFKEYCVSKFGDEVGDKVYTFYRLLDKGKSSRTDKNLSLTERRKRSIDYLTDKFGEQHFVNGVEYFSNKLDAGEISVATIPYFNKVVENLTKQPTQTNPLFNQQKSIHDVIPFKLRRIEGSDSHLESFNWIYSCGECQTEFDAWAQDCPKCNGKINWRAISE